ncbi:primosomal protein N' (replication factor Y) - superfamily II helicase [Roseibaca sp. Y0-43]|uniref:primosomal protein N' (replication factor Y) - superfamily II helicase n=1 Tax=Roseibaca sp. Y0-43 TaxID=2816854 RepID=UPI001D0CD647|nr:primosomal protein N' (replication factor Y) - superfamily II helicase [Roseibaca sp. Y0-43]MCC1480624.1 primosomal protein N' (replication factor Y) - superfamily II helicase [Roseibaca sp. Y0-43]
MTTLETENRFPCGQCGASLRFTPGQGSLTCEYCGFVQDVPEVSDDARAQALATLDLHTALAERLSPEAMEVTRVSHCDTCGAEVQFDPNIHAAECPFCASPVVADTGTHRHIKPQALLPFKLGRDAAQAKMRDWLKGLWFAPNGLAKYARETGKLNGLYLPYWAFDADTKTRYTGQRGTHYYVTVGSGKNKRTERRTRWTRASGRVARDFTDVLVVASEALPRQNLRALEPWTLSDLTPYAADYLSGFRAEGYTVDLGPGYTIGQERMADVIRGDIRRDIGGDEQRIDTMHTDYADERFKHILLPIWMAAYRYKGKSYRFIVNGQSGRVQGERPYSVWKIMFAVTLALAFAAGVYYVAEMGG